MMTRVLCVYGGCSVVVAGTLAVNNCVLSREAHTARRFMLAPLPGSDPTQAWRYATMRLSEELRDIFSLLQTRY
ncbi:MAG: hypothetical protein ACU836_08880 [Gammaproteobacteria bacterium]